MAHDEPCFLAIDVGTGSVRAAVVSAEGQVIRISQKPHETFSPRPGWVEQSPDAWWRSVQETVGEALSAAPGGPAQIRGVCVCGQMHGPVPIDASGNVLLDRVQLWNDKRSEEICRQLRAEADEAELLGIAANPIASSWIALKVAWIRRHQAEVYDRAAAMLVPKDFINFRLTGEIATDDSEASGSFLLDHRTLAYSPRLAEKLHLDVEDVEKFAPVHRSHDVIGQVTAQAAAETNLPVGTPVVAGGGDFPVSLLGSGVTRPGVGSDVTGTSTLISVYSPQPLVDERMMNLHAAGGWWIPFAILDAGGECVRWARRLIAPGDASYESINAAASGVAPGAGGLVFLPYLTGERIGGRTDRRAQFFGICADHGPEHFHRAVFEGSALASKRNIELMRSLGCDFDEIVATGGGAKSDLWLEIKAGIYNLPVRVPAEVESGVLGCAILAGCGTGTFSSPAEAADRLVKTAKRVEPRKDLVEAYAPLAETFNRLYDRSQEPR